MEINFIYSPMNSGKTTEIINKSFIYESRGCYVFLVKPKIDNRNSETKIVSRTQQTKKVDYIFDKYDEDFENFLKKVLYHQGILFIDEAQFFNYEDVIKICTFLRKNKNICEDSKNTKCFAYGLLKDFNNQLFDGTKAWIEQSDNLQPITSKCSTWGCQKDATCNYLLIDEDNSDDNILIGDSIYKPLCQECYLKHMLMKENGERFIDTLEELDEFE